MRILVTGGAGFIGSSLIRHIIKNTEYHVLNLDNLTYAGNLNSLQDCDQSQRYSFIKADICNLKDIEEIFNIFKPTCIMHLAAESHVDRSIESPDNFMQTNIIGTFNLLEVSRKYLQDSDSIVKKSFRFHHISTDEVYGDLHDDSSYFTENTSYKPSSPYSASKAASDHLVRAWHRTYELPILITNCSNNYGPYHFPEKLIPSVIINALQGKTISVYGDGSQIRDWLYVEDHVNALIEVVLRGKLGETYNIGGNNEKKNIDVVLSICSLLEELAPNNKVKGLESYKDLIEFVKDRPGHDLRYAIDASKIKNELNWSPAESFGTGLRKTVEWFLNNQNWYEKILSGEYIIDTSGEMHE